MNEITARGHVRNDGKRKIERSNTRKHRRIPSSFLGHLLQFCLQEGSPSMPVASRYRTNSGSPRRPGPNLSMFGHHTRSSLTCVCFIIRGLIGSLSRLIPFLFVRGLCPPHLLLDSASRLVRARHVRPAAHLAVPPLRRNLTWARQQRKWYATSS